MLPVRHTATILAGLMIPKADHDEQPGQGREGQLADRSGEEQRDDGDDHAGEDVREPRPGSAVDDERGRGGRASDRHALEEAGGYVGRALPYEIPEALGYRPSGFTNAWLTPAPWMKPDDGQGERGHDECGPPGEVRQGRSGQTLRDLGYVRDLGHRIPAEEVGKDRGHDDGHHQAQSAEPGLLQHDDEDDRAQPHRERREIDLVEVEEQIDCAGHLVAVLARVPGEVAQLAQDDDNGHPGHEPTISELGTKRMSRPNLRKPASQHDDPGEERQGEDHARRVAAGSQERSATTTDMALVVCTLRKTELAKNAPTGVASMTA